MELNIEQATYPIGKYHKPDEHMPEMQNDWISAIEALPTWLDPCIENLDNEQLEVPYRPGGWNTRQIIHHLADSHMNGYIRLKLALTEDNPIIKPYDQDRWALLPDVEIEPLNISITLLHALHRRWGTLLRNLREEDWERTYFHPEYEQTVSVWEMADNYAWHGRHHMEQIRSLRTRMNW